MATPSSPNIRHFCNRTKRHESSVYCNRLNRSPEMTLESYFVISSQSR
jgi:hypothetical protein